MRQSHDGHIHPLDHFCGSNCPMYRPSTAPNADRIAELERKVEGLLAWVRHDTPYKHTFDYFMNDYIKNIREGEEHRHDVR